jgi:hypothetical protein
MDARRFKRLIVNIQAELLSADKRLAVYIENLSEEGMYVTAPVKSSFNFITDMPIEIRFELPSGEKLNLHCKVKWVYRTPPHGLTDSVGMTIIDPPLTYVETLKALQ